MEQNLFEELQERKQHLVSIAKKATEYGWITLERQQEIIDKLENDTLTIGVIGQMKCGKSTFLNSFVFEDDVLTIIAGDDKPIKFVYEGDPIVLMGDPMTNADLTQEYLYGEKYGLGIVLAGGNVADISMHS